MVLLYRDGFRSGFIHAHSAHQAELPCCVFLLLCGVHYGPSMDLLSGQYGGIQQYVVLR